MKVYIWETKEKVISFRGLSSEEEARIRDILVPTYRYWGGGSITVTETGESTLNVGVETRAATISIETLSIETLGKKLAREFKVDRVVINNAVYTTM